MTRYVTDSPERFRIYRLCDCTSCAATGKASFVDGVWLRGEFRCRDCRGEGRTRDLVATCASAEAVGVALVTLGREGEWDECPVGVLDTEPEEGQAAWILKPWLPSARNTSQAGRVLAQAKGKTA